MIQEFLTNDQLIALYLLYVNDFLTVERYAEYLGLEFITASEIIDAGRELNNNQ